MQNQTQNTDLSIFAKRREDFFRKMENQSDNAIAIVPAHPELIRNDDVHFKFRQDSNFYYLTGFEESDAVAVFRSIGGKRDFTMFVKPKDLAKEIWTGYLTGVEGAVKKYGANKAYPIDEFDKQMESLLQNAERVYYGFFRTLHRNGVEFLDAKVMRLLDLVRLKMGRTGKGIPPIHDILDIISDMRIIKSAGEIELMRRASDISARAHSEVMARCKPGLFEYQIEALLEYVFRNEGCARHGYSSIVASGMNATILHYIENSRQLESGDLLLIDAAGEYGYYSSDITRTFPVNGRFTKEQLELYQITLAIQKECIKMAKPGATLLGIHQFAVQELTDAMVKLKFLTGMSTDAAVQTLAYKKYYPHGTGHLLGMDVHDRGLYYIDGEPRKLEAGMAFTIEPGFYVLFDDMNVPEKYRGIGIRIEDDVVITNNACEVLTTGVPKEVDDMCALIGTKKWLSLN